MLIGYARVPTQDQKLKLQTEALTKAGCKKVFEDKISGSRDPKQVDSGCGDDMLQVSLRQPAIASAA